MKHPYGSSASDGSSVHSDESDRHPKLSYHLPSASPLGLDYDTGWVPQAPPKLKASSAAEVKAPVPAPPRKPSRFRTLSQSALRSIRKPKHPAANELIPPIPVPATPLPDYESSSKQAVPTETDFDVSGWLDETDSADSADSTSSLGVDLMESASATDTAESRASTTDSRASSGILVTPIFEDNEVLVPPSLITDSDSIPSPTLSPQPKSLVFRIKGKDDAAVDLPPVPIPYETRRSERALANKKHDVWRSKVANMMLF
ncbi:hypothetical protein K438DRAFT_1963173 [Mycena galopus ATCC 62051]|nr:hypothetical protein K438DRAFT_1963173 [Mycena galopus ATCC 62051]